jgi:hypothetical protein
MDNLKIEDWKTMGSERANEILSSLPLIKRLEVLQETPNEMTPYGHWLKVSKIQLVSWYMNAQQTSICLGHKKRDRNNIAVEEYLQLMEKYNCPTPSREMASLFGIFNGEGSK